MPRIKIVPFETLSYASRLDSNLNQLNDIASQISSTSSRLNWSVKSKSNIDSNIQDALNKSKNLSSELSSLSSYIKNATSRLVEADKSGEKGILNRIKKYNKTQAEIYQEAYINKIVSKKPVIKNPGDYYFEDIDGENIDQVIYLNYEHFLFDKAGHAAIILKKSDGSGIYYSYGIPAQFTDTKIEYGINGFNIATGQDYPGILNRRDLSPNDMENFMKGGSGSIPKYEGLEPTTESSYTRYISVPVTEDQGRSMFQTAQDIFNKDNKRYNLYDENCNHITQKILKAANLSFTPEDYGKAAGIGVAVELFPINGDNKRIGIVPNDAYSTGVLQWNAYKGSDSGSFYK